MEFPRLYGGIVKHISGTITTLTKRGIMANRKEYTKEFKQEAVRLARERGNKSQVVRDLGIHASMLSRWEAKFSELGDQGFPGKGHVQNEDLAQLQRENQRLQETVEILKKAVGIFSSRPR